MQRQLKYIFGLAVFVVALIGVNAGLTFGVIEVSDPQAQDLSDARLALGHWLDELNQSWDNNYTAPYIYFIEITVRSVYFRTGYDIKSPLTATRPHRAPVCI